MEKIKQARLTIFGNAIVDLYVPPVAKEDRSLPDALRIATDGAICPKDLQTWFEGSDIVIVDRNLLKTLTDPPLKLGELRIMKFGVNETNIPIKYSALIRYGASPGSMRVKTRPYKVYR